MDYIRITQDGDDPYRIQEAVDGEEVDWMEKVTDEQYGA